MADSVFLSPAAMQWLHLKNGDTLHLRSGTQAVNLRVAGSLLRARAGQRLAVMDIASAQWRFGKLGLLSHIDIRLVDGVNRSVFRQELAQRIGSGMAGVVQHQRADGGAGNARRAAGLGEGGLARAAQHGLQAGLQLLHVEGLGDVVVGPGVQATPCDVKELEARVRALARRGTGGGASIWKHGPLTFDQVGRIAYINDDMLDLSAREVGLLEVLLQRVGRLV
eukprot:gene954-1341_t